MYHHALLQVLFFCLILKGHTILPTIYEDREFTAPLSMKMGLHKLHLDPQAAENDTLYEFAPLFERHFQKWQESYDTEGNTGNLMDQIPHQPDLQGKCRQLKACAILYDELSYGNIIDTTKGLCLRIQKSDKSISLLVPNDWHSNDGLSHHF